MKFKNLRGLVAVLGSVVLTLTVAAAPAQSAIPGPAQGDVYIRDQSSDFGLEPSQGRVWESPDIKTCDVPDVNCTPTNPIGGGTSYVVVTLNNPALEAPSVDVTGDLKLYYTKLGGAASWNRDWTPIGTIFGLTVSPGQKKVILQWPHVPDVGHVCLLARWESSEDPMTVPEVDGSNTMTNTQNNNNIAWRNVNIVSLRLPDIPWLVRPFTLRDPDPNPLVTDLAFTQPGNPFVNSGRIVVDLGPILAQRWREAGSPGVGVAQVDGTRVEILDPVQARIQGLRLERDEEFDTTLTFMAGNERGDFVVNAFQTDQQRVDLGGARFDITVG
jgi:hypothetical protein